MREDKTNRIAERQEPFLVLENQIICGYIIAFFASAFGRTVNLMSFLVDAEISGMSLMSFNITQILLIWCVKKGKIFIQNLCIFLLKDHSVLRIDLISVLIIFAILCNLINEKKRKHFNAFRKQFFFLFKMRADGLPDLHSP